MRDIIKEIRNFIRADFNIFVYGFAVLFLTGSIILNYMFDIEDKYIDIYFGTAMGAPVYFSFYFGAYMMVLIPTLLIKKQTHKLKRTELWIKIIVFFGMFAIMTAFHQYRDLASKIQNGRDEMYFLVKVFGNIKRILPFIIVFYIVKLIYDKDTNHIYGMRYRGMNYRPFFILILFMVPFIALASFQNDFQHTYPQFKFWKYENVFGMPDVLKVIIFEIAYGLDFVSIELLFRGALVIGLVKVLGKEAVLPMAVAYVFIHFGKPAGETISSFFGGFILGIHSYYRKNIFGGIIIHIGIAYSMELAAILQHIL